jgi:alanine racemase
MRPSWVEVDLAAIRANVAALAAHVAPAEVCAVVKADGYGHGDVPVAEAAVEGGASMLAVALVAEAIRLRDAGIEAPILLLSECLIDDVPFLAEAAITPTAYTVPFLQALSEHGFGGAIHLKLDTGMHRVGAMPEAAAGVVAAAAGLNLTALWTHLAVAEDDAEFTKQQLRLFDDLVERLAPHLDRVPRRHAANSAGCLLYSESHYEMVRPGLAIYGVNPAPAVTPGVQLQAAMRVVSHVTHLKPLPAGARPSYGRVRPLPHGGPVAIAPIGYADGVPRRYNGVGGEVLIGGRRRALAGNVTMDQIIIDVTDGDVEVGDEVVLIGSQGDDTITANEWADKLGTVSWEVLCRFGPRLPRVYRS